MATIQGIYIALFGRPADPAGLAFWEAETKGGTDLSGLIGRLTQSDEYLDRFEGQSQEEVVSSIYQALFGREPDAEGLAFFVDALQSGTQTIETIAINILDGARNADATIVENKEAAADLFTASLDTPEEIAAYTGDDAADAGRAFITEVTADPASVPTQAEVDQTIDEGVVNAPAEPTQPGSGGGGGGGGTPPVETFTVTHDFESLSKGVNGRDMVVGAGNPAGGFAVTSIEGNQGTDIEIALDARYKGVPTDIRPYSTSGNNTLFDVDAVDTVRFAYSVGSDKPLDLAKFEYKLLIDKDPGLATNFIEFKLAADTAAANQSPFKWVSTTDSNVAIIDDGGSISVTQNIQGFGWTSGPFGEGDVHDVSLQVFQKGTNTLVGQTAITIADIATATSQSLSLGAGENGYILAGSGNPNEKFAIVSSGGVELGLSGRYTNNPNIVSGTVQEDGLVHFQMEPGSAARFAFSVASNTNLDGNVFKLLIDTEAASGAPMYVEFTRASDGSWISHNEGPVIPKEYDQDGVAQDILNIAWFDNVAGDSLAEGHYDVTLEAYRADGVTLIGQNHVVFDISEPR